MDFSGALTAASGEKSVWMWSRSQPRWGCDVRLGKTKKMDLVRIWLLCEQGELKIFINWFRSEKKKLQKFSTSTLLCCCFDSRENISSPVVSN